jgi:hypothetical protein
MRVLFRKAAAVALLLMIFALVIEGVVLPLMVLDSEAEGMLDALRHYQAIAADRGRLSQEIAALPPPPGAEAGRLPQAGDALAQAELQSRLSTLAGQLGLAVSAAEPLAAESEDGSGRILLRLDLGGSLAAIQALIHAVESGRPVMAVTQLDLAARPDRQGLAAHLTIAAWRSVP